MIIVQQAKRQRGVHTYKEPSRHEDTTINVQQAKKERHAGRHKDNKDSHPVKEQAVNRHG
jgi:hypothetical protein